MSPGPGSASPSAPHWAGGGAPAPASPPVEAARSGLVRALAGVTIAGLAVISLVYPASTRMFAWPWTIAYAATLAAPVALVLLRAFDPVRPLVTPSRGWTGVAVAAVAVILGSALLSPYRASALEWGAPDVAAVAVFFAVFDWLHRNGPAGPRREIAAGFGCWGFLIIAGVSLADWLHHVSHAHSVFAARNPYPLGHSNYTAGLAVLMLPGFVAAARRGGRPGRWLGVAGGVLALVLLFTSGSRAGVIALGAMAALAFLFAPLRRATKVRLAVVGLLALAAFIAANPRTRAMFLPRPPEAAPNPSNVQRRAMLLAGARMGRDRPLLGWGPGTTPLVYPRYRAGLDGGAENVLQLHSLPVALWAELGLAGLLCAAAGAGLLLRDATRDRVAFASLAGYAVFAVFDFQLDIPVFGYALAGLAALVAAPAVVANPRPRGRRGVAGVMLAAFALVVALGRRDPTPAWNAEALAIGDTPSGRAPAIALLRRSLAANPDQEIAHFNLGWLLVASDPPAAARHFLAAARLVPDRRGVYFGLGLSRLNAGHPRAAVAAFALELLNDPTFQLSPWWRQPRLTALFPAALRQLAADESQLMAALPAGTWPGSELRYVRVLQAWLRGQVNASAVAAAADTPARRRFFQGRPAPSVLRSLPARTLRYERLGYPVLMRNLDVPPPVDLWVAEESTARISPLRQLWPETGWVPSPLLLALLDGRPLPTR